MSVQSSKNPQPNKLKPQAAVAPIIPRPFSNDSVKPGNEIHSVMASSFADLADLKAFKRAKAAGMTDMQAFAVGDNGIGFAAMPVENDNTWVPIEHDNDNRIDCGTENVCACALPPEIWLPKWENAKNAAGKRVFVTYQGKTVKGILGDTMPHIKNITNGAGIDLNPGFAKSFGIKSGFMIPVTWSWA